MKEFHELVARVGTEHWILLTQSFASGEWAFLIWGPNPYGENLGLISESEAKRRAWFATREHLLKHGIRTELSDASELYWRVAVKYIAA